MPAAFTCSRSEIRAPIIPRIFSAVSIDRWIRKSTNFPRPSTTSRPFDLRQDLLLFIGRPWRQKSGIHHVERPKNSLLPPPPFHSEIEIRVMRKLRGDAHVRNTLSLFHPPFSRALTLHQVTGVSLSETVNDIVALFPAIRTCRRVVWKKRLPSRRHIFHLRLAVHPVAPAPPPVQLFFRNPENRRTFRLRANPAL